MRRSWRSWALALAVAGLFFWSVISLFNRQFASGEVYPEFSTMRTDQEGAKLLYDSLGRLPGITVERNFQPFEFLPRDGVTLVLLGMDPMEVNWNGPLFLRRVTLMASRGNRVVVATHVDPEDPPRERGFTEPPGPSPKKKGKPEPPPLQILWQVKFGVDSTKGNAHPLYFAEAQGWTVRDQAGAKILAIERNFGKGSVVLMAESSDFTNESTVALDRLAEIAGVLGPYPRIIFDEEHLGIAESGSVVGMARRFRLTGLAIGLGLCAALFIWRNASGFPPPAPARPGERFSGRTSHAGLLTLLKRHIPPAELATVCWREWLGVNRHEVTADRVKKAEEILANSAPQAARRAVEATREIQAVLHVKGEL
jgi:hypothetical protein